MDLGSVDFDLHVPIVLLNQLWQTVEKSIQLRVLEVMVHPVDMYQQKIVSDLLAHPMALALELHVKSAANSSNS